MKNIVRFLIITAAIAAFSAVVFGQSQRIKFARGATSAVVSGSLNSYKSKRTFVIRVRAGQKLTTAQVGNNYITVDIKPPAGSTWEPDMAADCHNRHEVEPTDAGDYILTVTECRKADRWRGKFRLRVTVR